MHRPTWWASVVCGDGYIHEYPRKICGYGYGYGWIISYLWPPWGLDVTYRTTSESLLKHRLINDRTRKHIISYNGTISRSLQRRLQPTVLAAGVVNIRLTLPAVSNRNPESKYLTLTLALSLSRNHYTPYTPIRRRGERWGVSLPNRLGGMRRVVSSPIGVLPTHFWHIRGPQNTSDRENSVTTTTTITTLLNNAHSPKSDIFIWKWCIKSKFKPLSLCFKNTWEKCQSSKWRAWLASPLCFWLRPWVLSAVLRLSNY